MNYHVDRFHAAVSVLAAHGHIKQRLISAYENHLEEITADDLPEATREAFDELRKQMYRVAPSNGESPVCASVRKMSIDQASECAVSVVDLYRSIARLSGAGQPDLPLDSKRQPVPPFLVKSN